MGDKSFLDLNQMVSKEPLPQSLRFLVMFSWIDVIAYKREFSWENQREKWWDNDENVIKMW